MASVISLRSFLFLRNRKACRRESLEVSWLRRISVILIFGSVWVHFCFTVLIISFSRITLLSFFSSPFSVRHLGKWFYVRLDIAMRSFFMHILIGTKGFIFHPFDIVTVSWSEFLLFSTPLHMHFSYAIVSRTVKITRHCSTLGIVLTLFDHAFPDLTLSSNLENSLLQLLVMTPHNWRICWWLHSIYFAHSKSISIFYFSKKIVIFYFISLTLNGDYEKLKCS